MQFNVAQLLMEPIGATRTYDLVDDLSDLDVELDVLGPLVGKIQLMRIHSGVLVTGILTTAVSMMCNRCLSPIVIPVSFTLEESFRPLTEVSTGRYIRPDEFEGEEADLEDAALLIDEHHILDVAEVVRQSTWLSLPMVPGCNWEGPGECPSFTEHLNELEGMELGPHDVEKQHETDAIDPRWSALLGMSEDGEETE